MHEQSLALMAAMIILDALAADCVVKSFEAATHAVTVRAKSFLTPRERLEVIHVKVSEAWCSCCACLVHSLPEDR